MILAYLHPLIKRYSPNDWISINEILNLGKRILFNSGADLGEEMYDTIFPKYGPELCNWSEPDYKNFSPFPKCIIDGDRANSGHIVRMATSQLQYGPFNAGFHIGPNEGVLTPENLPPVIECNMNYPSPDLLNHKKVEAMIWSWAKGEPKRDNSSDGECAVLDSEIGKWRTMPCYEKFSHACRNLSNVNDWKLGTPTVFDDKSNSCPKGYVFVSPVNAYQNAVIKQKLIEKSSSFAWINVVIE